MKLATTAFPILLPRSYYLNVFAGCWVASFCYLVNYAGKYELNLTGDQLTITSVLLGNLYFIKNWT
jgi:hypothetical protein